MLGYCKYCGQSMMTERETQEGADYEAEMNCKCKEGMEYRNTEDMKEAAKANAGELFPEEEAITYSLINNAIDALAAGAIKKCSVKIDERTTCNLIRTAKDGIQIKRDYKENFTLEANKY